MTQGLAPESSRRRRYFTCALLATWLVWLPGCDCNCTDPDGDAVGMATMALTIESVPDGVGCAVVIVASDGPRVHRVDVAPGQSTTSDLGVLPAGQTVVSVEAIQGPCNSAAPSTIVVAVGGPLIVNLSPGTNPPLTVALQADSGGQTLFDPMAGRTCKAPSATCDNASECCYGFCYRGTAEMPLPGHCAANEPPPTTLQLERSLRPLGPDGRGSLPEFDGDAFFVAFPGPQLSLAETMNVETVRGQFIAPVAAAIGFTSLTSLKDPVGFRTLPGGDYDQLRAAKCIDAGQEGGPSKAVCDLLAAPAQSSAAGRELAIRLGMPLASIAEEVNRPLHYWFFRELERGIPLEHKGAMAIQHGPSRQVSAVFGALLQRHRVVNTVARNSRGASVAALAALRLLEGLKTTANSTARREAILVLLPYGTLAREQQTTALRFAWRMAAVGQLSGPLEINHRTYTIWVDAENGDLLKYAADSASDGIAPPPPLADAGAEVNVGVPGQGGLDAGPTAPDAAGTDAGSGEVADAAVDQITLPNSQHRIWCRDPGTGGSCSVPAYKVGSLFPLQNSSFQIVGGSSAASPTSSESLATGTPLASYACDITNPGLNFRQANAFFHLERARAFAQHGGKLVGFGQPIKVHLDSAEPDNYATFDPLSIKFRRAVGVCSSPVLGQVLPGDVDGTIVAHEFAHLITLKLQAEQRCDDVDCPSTNPYHREAFHDYADGYAAVVTETPCIGGWSYRNAKPNSFDVDAETARARACGAATEGGKLPRLLYAEERPDRKAFTRSEFATARTAAGPTVSIDRFPVHREVSAGPYGDGQIVGAALWHAWEGLQSQAGETASLLMFGRLNRAIAMNGFSPTVCAKDSAECDSNIYRAGRELLYHLTDAWISSEAPQSTNKVLSAFARAGIFLAPRNCLDRVAPGATETTVPHFCDGGSDHADAIVDIADGDINDGPTRNGVHYQDDDFVAFGASPVFRIWTGPLVQFDSTGKARDMNMPACNDGYEIMYRYRRLAQTEEVWSTWTTVKQEATNVVNKCYVEHTIIGPPAWANETEALVVQYKANTWLGAKGNSDRSSVKPGRDFWQRGAEGIAPAVFFVSPPSPPP